MNQVRQLERAVGKGSWKEREVGKFEMKLERMKLKGSSRSWKVQPKLEMTIEVEKFSIKLETSTENLNLKLERSI